MNWLSIGECHNDEVSSKDTLFVFLCDLCMQRPSTSGTNPHASAGEPVAKYLRVTQESLRAVRSGRNPGRCDGSAANTCMGYNGSKIVFMPIPIFQD